MGSHADSGIDSVCDCNRDENRNCIGDPDAHRNSDTCRNCHGDTYSDCLCDGHRDSDGYRDRDRDGDCNADADEYRHRVRDANFYAHTAAAAKCDGEPGPASGRFHE